MRAGKEKLKAEVVEYRNEKSPMRNDYTQIPYPYVRIRTDRQGEKLVKLKYANSLYKPFKIGEEVEVFWYAGVLYFWHTYDKGITKFLPA